MAYARLRFLALFSMAALAAGVALAAGSRVGLAIAATAAGGFWVAAIVDETRRGIAAADEISPTPRGAARGRVARAIAMSWLIPGSGQLYVGDRVAGLVTVALFTVAWVSGNFVFASPWPLAPLMVLVRLAGQIRVRRLLGVTWDPLVPSVGELFGRG